MVDVATRFWSKVEKTPGCWKWRAGCDGRGYGEFRLGTRMRGAHRVAWELTRGVIPEGLCVLHSCDNPRCVRPNHLFLGTVADNNADKAAKGRAVRLAGEKHGCSRLRTKDIYLIRSLSAELSRKEIAEIFKVDPTHISKILRGKRWGHLSCHGTGGEANGM